MPLQLASSFLDLNFRLLSTSDIQIKRNKDLDDNFFFFFGLSVFCF